MAFKPNAVFITVILLKSITLRFLDIDILRQFYPTINELRLRQATHLDLHEMQQLFKGTISSLCTNDYDDDQIGVWVSAVDNKERWLDKINKQYFLIAELENKIVGYGSLENGDYLDFMYAHKDYQRQGIAKAILTELEKEAVRCGSLEIMSDVSKAARLFFERNSFVVLSENLNTSKGVEIMNYKMSKKL